MPTWHIPFRWKNINVSLSSNLAQIINTSILFVMLLVLLNSLLLLYLILLWWSSFSTKSWITHIYRMIYLIWKLNHLKSLINELQRKIAGISFDPEATPILSWIHILNSLQKPSYGYQLQCFVICYLLDTSRKTYNL